MAKLMSNFVKENEKWTLTIDRTNWKLGKTHINFLVLAIAYKGMAIPILWTILKNRGGNSSHKQRVKIMKRFINIFGKERIKVLIADREFIGKEWFKWLQKEDIKFTIRVKAGNYIQVKDKRKKAEQLFSLIKTNESKTLYKASLYGYTGLNLIGIRTEKELIVFATNMMESSEALESYKKRWEIETMFSAFKKRGFDLEATHMTAPEKLSLLFGMISIAFAWSYMVGIWKHHNVKKIKILSHKRKEKSYFLYGLEHLSSILYRDYIDKVTISPILMAIPIKNDDY
jgi:hypothetical protein